MLVPGGQWMKLSLISLWLKRNLRIKVWAVVFAASVVLLVEVLIGKGHRLSDAVCILAAALATWSFGPIYTKFFKAGRRIRSEHRAARFLRSAKLPFIFLLLAWIFISAADICLRPALKTRPVVAARLHPA
jgi:hypothetical protein